MIDTTPEGEVIADVQLATAGTGAAVRHAVAWLRRPASGTAATVEAQAFAGACEP